MSIPQVRYTLDYLDFDRFGVRCRVGECLECFRCMEMLVLLLVDRWRYKGLYLSENISLLLYIDFMTDILKFECTSKSLFTVLECLPLGHMPTGHKPPEKKTTLTREIHCKNV